MGSAPGQTTALARGSHDRCSCRSPAPPCLPMALYAASRDHIRARFAASGESGGVPGTASSSSSDSLLLSAGSVALGGGHGARVPSRAPYAPLASELGGGWACCGGGCGCCTAGGRAWCAERGALLAAAPKRSSKGSRRMSSKGEPTRGGAAPPYCARAHAALKNTAQNMASYHMRRHTRLHTRLHTRARGARRGGGAAVGGVRRAGWPVACGSVRRRACALACGALGQDGVAGTSTCPARGDHAGAPAASPEPCAGAPRPHGSPEAGRLGIGEGLRCGVHSMLQCVVHSLVRCVVHSMLLRIVRSVVHFMLHRMVHQCITWCITCCTGSRRVHYLYI